MFLQFRSKKLNCPSLLINPDMFLFSDSYMLEATRSDKTKRKHNLDLNTLKRKWTRTYSNMNLKNGENARKLVIQVINFFWLRDSGKFIL